MMSKTIIDIDVCESKRENFIKYPEKSRRSMINVYKNYIRNLEVEVDNNTRFQQLLPFDITQHDINSNKSLRTNLQKMEWLKKSRQNSPLPQNSLNLANYVSAMKNTFLVSSLASACSYQPVNPNEAYSRMFDDLSSQVYKDDWEVDSPSSRYNTENNWLVIPKDRNKIPQRKTRRKLDDDPDWSAFESTILVNDDVKQVTRKSMIQSCNDSASKIIDLDNNEPQVVKRKRSGRPKGAKNKIRRIKNEYQDELSWEDIQAIEKLNQKSIQASARNARAQKRC